MATVQQVKSPDLYGTIKNAPQLPSQFQVAPTPIIGSNDLKSIQDTHQIAYDRAMQFGQMNPDVVMQALSPGGSLSSSFGFSNAGDVAGLTPDQLMALTQGRGINESLQGAKKTLDTITNAPENRAAMMHIADQQFGVNSNMLAQQNSQALQAAQANASNALGIAKQQVEQAQQADQFNAGQSNSYAQHLDQIHSNEKIAANSNAVQLANVRAQLQMHKETMQAGIQSAQTQKQWELRQADFNQFTKLLDDKAPTEATTQQLNSLMSKHPEWNTQGVYYEHAHIDNAGHLHASRLPIPKQLTPAVLKTGEKIWMKPDGTFFSYQGEPDTVVKPLSNSPVPR